MYILRKLRPFYVINHDNVKNAPPGSKPTSFFTSLATKTNYKLTNYLV